VNYTRPILPKILTMLHVSIKTSFLGKTTSNGLIQGCTIQFQNFIIIFALNNGKRYGGLLI